jgi:RNA polymerase sigma-70 factor (ECF subfamily)
MDDRAFVHKCVTGDRHALDEFLARYSRLIYNYIYSVLRVKGLPENPETAADLFQEMILLLFKDNFKKLRSFKGKNGCSLASWLRMIVVNQTLDYVKQKKPSISLEEEREDGLNLKDIIASGSQPVPDGLSRKEELGSLEECIEVLNTDDKYFLEMHFNRNLGFDELMGHFSASRGAIDMRKMRIIEKLRDCFKNKGYFR